VSPTRHQRSLLLTAITTRPRWLFLYGSVWVYLFALGIVASTAAFAAAATSGLVVKLRVYLAVGREGASSTGGLAVWVGFSVVAVLLSTVVTASYPGCAGSGIPRMYVCNILFILDFIAKITKFSTSFNANK
jgi:hypothetical protein